MYKRNNEISKTKMPSNIGNFSFGSLALLRTFILIIHNFNLIQSFLGSTGGKNFSFMAKA